MATPTVSTNPTTDKTPEPQYWTRYGRTTASEAALDLLDRARFRSAFISTMFKACLDKGITIPDYETGGLAFILDDIAFDIATAYNYYFGDDNEPGKLFGTSEVKS